MEECNKQYKANFLEHLFRLLEEYLVYIFAISAHMENIVKSVDHFLKELQVSEKYKLVKADDKNTDYFGPFYNEQNEKITIKISENRAIMALFIAHFVIRMHRIMWKAENLDSPHYLNWNFLGDKFPGPQNDDMDLMVSILFQADNDTGRIVWGNFDESDKVVTDLLADNIAGMLNDIKSQ